MTRRNICNEIVYIDKRIVYRQERYLIQQLGISTNFQASLRMFVRMYTNLIQRHSLSRDTVEIACQKDLLDSKNRTHYTIRFISLFWNVVLHEERI